MIANFEEAISEDSTFNSLSLIEILADEKLWLKLLSKFYTAVGSTAAQYHEHFSEDGLKTVVSAIRGWLLNARVSFIHKRIPQNLVILKADRPYLNEWMREIVHLQRESSQILPPPLLEEGDSQGVTFAITRGRKIYGYLFGTLHQLDSMPDAENVIKISKEVQKRLSECAILGTEILCERGRTQYSIEGTLYQSAEKRGIINLGIDDEDREYLSAVRDKIWAKLHKGPLKSPIIALTRILMSPYRSGDVEKMKNIFEGMASSFSKELIQIELIRNVTMAENIDHILRESHSLEKETGILLKCFFAIGTFHVISTSSIQSVAELISRKGWSVRPLSPLDSPSSIFSVEPQFSRYSFLSVRTSSPLELDSFLRSRASSSPRMPLTPPSIASPLTIMTSPTPSSSKSLPSLRSSRSSSNYRPPMTPTTPEGTSPTTPSSRGSPFSIPALQTSSSVPKLSLFTRLRRSSSTPKGEPSKITSSLRSQSSGADFPLSFSDAFDSNEAQVFLFSADTKGIIYHVKSFLLSIVLFCHTYFSKPFYFFPNLQCYHLLPCRLQ